MRTATIHTAQPCPRVLERNLAALNHRSARAVDRIRAAAPPTNVEFLSADDGALTASIRDNSGTSRQLASKRAPLAEADRFAESIDIAAAATVVVRGFGLGYHIAALARRVGFHGAVIVFESDVALLRAVLERIDCTPWLTASNIAIITDADDTGVISAAASGLEGILAAGTTLVDHPPSRGRIGTAGDRFAQHFTTVMKAVRTNVVTTLVQVDTTVRNLLQNLRWYASAPGVEDLKDATRGRPAVVVSAGPSLRRNIELLSRPGVRDRVLIIAVQTVLKTLLKHGIRPHFVTALDYHEISRRFYEGLTALDVEGVTLVAEPKANPAILSAFPGAIRCPADRVLDSVLGEKLARPMGQIPPGATVAHLAYYLARHLGCDPVILIGQDLAFTDGQYYAPGAAIHQVWSGELNDFNTLEMLEWQRIARMRSLLRRVTDQQGRPVYTDEQMATYLVQFERDFMRDAQAGLTTIDATEGGVRKAHATVMPLADALARHAAESPLSLPPAPGPDDSRRRTQDVEQRLRTLRHDSQRIATLSRDAAAILREMLEHHEDQPRVNRLIARVTALAAEAAAATSYWLVHYINQTGYFNRFRADRAIEIDSSLSPLDRQRKEIERDLTNVTWLGDAADHVCMLLDDATIALTTGVVQTRDEPPAPTTVSGANPAARSIWATILVDPARGGLGTPRALSRPLVSGMNALQMTLARLARCRYFTGILLLTENEETTRKLVGPIAPGLRIETARVDLSAMRARTRSVAAARLWSRHCWRGGIANLTCHDEVFCPRTLAPLMSSRGIDAAVILGPDWSLIDPALTDAVIARHLERPESHHLTFTQAAPGLAPCLLSRNAVTELAAANSPFASIGGLLGYIPTAPQADPIVKPVCAPVEPVVRDLLVRCIADDERSIAAINGTIRSLGEETPTASAAEIAAAITRSAAPSTPEMVTLWLSRETRINRTIDALRELALLDQSLALTVRSRSDILGLPAWRDVASAAREAGFAAIHLRTPLTDERSPLLDLSAVPLDVLSIDLSADTPATHRLLTGVDSFDAIRADIDRLLASRTAAGLPHTWIVPRITRRDAVYAEIEDFYNRWLLAAGACVIDPLDSAINGERIEPLPAPANVRERRRWSMLTIREDGAIEDGLGSRLGTITSEPIGTILDRRAAAPTTGAPIAEPKHFVSLAS